jgi:hypothetical protein
VSPRVRKIAAHNPDQLPAAEYLRQIFWSSAIDLPADLEKLLREVTLEGVELPPGERAILSLQLPEGTLIVFDPVTHTAQFLDVRGEEVSERQNLSMIFNKLQVPVDTVALRPGPLRLALQNRTDSRVLAGCMDSEPGAGRPSEATQAHTQREAPPHQSNLPRHLPDRHLAIGQRLKI